MAYGKLWYSVHWWVARVCIYTRLCRPVRTLSLSWNCHKWCGTAWLSCWRHEDQVTGEQGWPWHCDWVTGSRNGCGLRSQIHRLRVVTNECTGLILLLSPIPPETKHLLSVLDLQWISNLWKWGNSCHRWSGHYIESWVETCLTLTTLTADQAWCRLLLGMSNCCWQCMYHIRFGMNSHKQPFHTQH